MRELCYSNLTMLHASRRFFALSLSVFSIFFFYFNMSNQDVNLFVYFCLFVLMLSFLSFSESLFSPLNIVIGYYVLWYVIAPLFGPGYTWEQLNSMPYRWALFYLLCGFCFIIESTKIGCTAGAKLKTKSISIHETVNLNLFLFFYILLSILSTISVVLIVLYSGGIEVWLADPGDAFLNRAGSGAFVILSHFFSIALGVVTGFLMFKTRRKKYLWLYLLWVFLTMPIHGSKFQILLLFVLPFIPYLKNLKLLSVHTVLVILTVFTVFIVGMFFRGFEGGGLSRYLSLLGYFSTLHNLALLMRDVLPWDHFTFFYPFNKLLILIGEASFGYFDLNHLLTDIYYPSAWTIRATEQWPLEADMYVNFHFFGALPIVFIYFFLIGVIYSIAIKTNSLGWWFLSIMLSALLPSHLRGTLYNFNDFYLIPYLLLMTFLLKGYSIKAPVRQ